MVRREDGRSAQLKEKVRLTEGEILNCPLSGFKALRPTGDVLALRPACGRWRPLSTCSPPCVAAERRPRPRPSRSALAHARHSQIQDWLHEWLPGARHKAKNGGQNRASAMVFCRLISSGCTWPGGTEKSRTAPSRPVITSLRPGSGTFQYFSGIVQRYKAKSPRASSALVRDDRRVKRLLKRQQMRWTQR